MNKHVRASHHVRSCCFFGPQSVILQRTSELQKLFGSSVVEAGFVCRSCLAGAAAATTATATSIAKATATATAFATATAAAAAARTSERADRQTDRWRLLERLTHGQANKLSHKERTQTPSMQPALCSCSARLGSEANSTEKTRTTADNFLVSSTPISLYLSFSFSRLFGSPNLNGQ